MIPTFNTYGRVFVATKPIDGFKYYNSMMVGAIDKAMPTIEAVYTFNSRGRVSKIAEIVDSPREVTTTLSGILPLKSRSNLEKLFNRKVINIQVHFGTCANPSDFNNFESLIVLTDVDLTSYALTDVSAINPTKAVVQESANIVANGYYRILNLSYINSLTQSTIFGLDYINSPSCKEINDNGEGWITIYQSTNVKFKYTFDNGLTWQINSTDLTAHQTTANKAAMKSVKDKVFWAIVNSSTLKLYVVSLDNIISNSTVVESEILSKSNANIRDMSATSKYLWCCGESNGLSLLTKTDLSNNSTEVIDDGDFHIAPATALDVYDDNFIVIVYGDSPTYVVYQDNDVYVGGISFGDGAKLTDIKVLTKSHWVVSGDKGIYVTYDGGNTWKKSFVLTSDTKLNFYDEITGYAMSGNNIYRTVDGGVSWVSVQSSLFSTPITVEISPIDCNNIFFASSGLLINGYA